MSIPAENAIRAWINGLPIVGDGNALSRGAYLREQRSPADGPYAVLARMSEGVTTYVAEDNAISSARMQIIVYAGTVESSEAAAAALMGQIEQLTGCPQNCGTTGVRILVTDNRLGPFAIPVAPDTGETYAFQVNADFVLTAA